MTTRLTFAEAGRVPMPEDNVAIATRRLEAGTVIADNGADNDTAFTLAHTVMEGHRFVRHPIAEGEPLMSWELPFGYALRKMNPGEYVCNEKILQSLSHRDIDFALPEHPNFRDNLAPFRLDESTFSPGTQVARATEAATFQGFRRSGRRGVGTRNFIVILATTSLTAGFARALAARFEGRLGDLENVSGVVAVTHTEGGGAKTPNNLDFLLRALAGFMVHPNVGAVLAVDYGTEGVNNETLRRFMTDHDYPLHDVTSSFFSIQGAFTEALQRAEEEVGSWLPQVNDFSRSEESAGELKIALQCGGSDAFSGVSGNPLAGWVAKEVIRHGGAANLAETDELIGAEPYVLSNVSNVETARRFLEKIDIFKERAAWHGHSAEGNPSGGNQYRGLYNINLKSIGAARKKDPEVRLDHVIDYGAPMREPGYYFMDSPGNDLESIAGQVAAGSNVILFVTGNGSITNFPFVPTLKFVTTTGRWEMLANEMDVNAGRFQDGMAMNDLGRETFELVIDVASGQLSLGEEAGHSQVSIWRDWRQTDGSRLEELSNAPVPGGNPLPMTDAEPGLSSNGVFHALQTPGGAATDQVGLVIPTSLCSAQVARLIADKLNEKAGQGAHTGVSRYVALVHTEGCGAAPGYSTKLFLDTVLGHLAHPMVRKTLLLEHGCEQTHNDAMRHFLSDNGMDSEKLGWASVQMDGGIERVIDKAEGWFAEALTAEQPAADLEAGLGQLRIGLTAVGEIGEDAAAALALVARQIAGAGGLVVLTENSSLLNQASFRERLLKVPGEALPTLAYGQQAPQNGLHIMAAPTEHAIETFSGLAATGVEVMIAHVAGHPLQAHPMVPLVQISGDEPTAKRFKADLDLTWNSTETLASDLLDLILRTASREYRPILFAQGNFDFQLTRGWLGLSL